MLMLNTPPHIEKPRFQTDSKESMEHPTFKRIGKSLLLPGHLRVDLMLMLNIPLTLHLLYPHHVFIIFCVCLFNLKFACHDDQQTGAHNVMELAYHTI